MFPKLGLLCLVVIWADVTKQRQLLAMGCRNKIGKNRHDIYNDYNDSSCRRKAKPKFTINSSCTEDSANAVCSL